MQDPSHPAPYYSSVRSHRISLVVDASWQGLASEPNEEDASMHVVIGTTHGRALRRANHNCGCNGAPLPCSWIQRWKHVGRLCLCFFLPLLFLSFWVLAPGYSRVLDGRVGASTRREGGMPRSGPGPAHPLRPPAQEIKSSLVLCSILAALGTACRWVEGPVEYSWAVE